MVIARSNLLPEAQPFLPGRTDEEDIHIAKEEWNSCVRESTHKGFILYTEYMKNPKAYLAYLPKPEQDSAQNYINICNDLTVRLIVPTVSPQQKVPDKVHTKNGSGIIVTVEPKHHGQTEKQTWSVYIATATQVLFDQTQAECITAELFYIDEHKIGVKKLPAVGIDQYNKGESCIIQCITNEKPVYVFLKKMLRKQKKLYKALPSNGNNLVVISHPHGLPKHISFGDRIEVCTDSSTPMFKLSRWKYTAATCNGSAGAPVLMLNNSQKKFSKQLIADFHVHCGVNEERNNFSGLARVPKKMANTIFSQIQASLNFSNDDDEFNRSKNQRQLKYCQDIYEVRNVGDLSFGMSRCNKNPGHTDFIQVNNFNKKYLPEQYQDDTLYDYIQLLIDLTGKLSVYYTSPKSSQFNQTADAPIKSSKRRVATGTVMSVIKVKDICPCPECNQASKPENVFYLVFVRTVKNIIFNDTEAHQSTFQMFDKEASLDTSLYGLRLIESETYDERSLVAYVTHDVKVGSKLANTLRELLKQDKKLTAKFEGSDDHRLAVIVSHPHGSLKCVSIGMWLNRNFVISAQDHLYIKYTYTTATCPGCAGAPILILGTGTPQVVEYLLKAHVHKETGDVYNTSCYGTESCRIKD